MRARTTWLLVFALAGCKTGGTNENVPAPVTETVGTNGGNVSNSNGDGVSIPPGALPGDTMISVTPTPDAPAPPTAMPVGTPITFGPEGQQFLKPVTVTISFDPAKLPPGKTAQQLAIFTAPAGTTAYTQLDTSVVDANHLSAQVTHFSTFVAGSPTACAVYCGQYASGCSSGGGDGTVVDLGAPPDGGSGGGPVFDGGTGCPPPTMGCECSTYCNADGTPATPGMCTGGSGGGTVVDLGAGGGSSGGGGSGGGSGGTGGGGAPGADAGLPNGGGGPSCTPGSGNSYTVQCSQNSCVCMVNGAAMATLPAITCSGDPSTVMAQFMACGFPGVYVPPPPPGSGGTVVDGGMSGGGGSPDFGGGGGPPDFGGGGGASDLAGSGGGGSDFGPPPDLAMPPGSPGYPCTMGTQCISGVCMVNMHCQ